MASNESPRANAEDAEADSQTPGENENDQAQPDPENPDIMNQHDLHGYDFEVKEQDRWLPIANGESCGTLHRSHQIHWFPTRHTPVVP